MNESNNVLNLSLSDLADLYGATESEITEYCSEMISEIDFRYTPVVGEARDKLILDIFKRIDSECVPVAGKERQPDWEKGWNENLTEFIESGYDIAKLVPKYFKKHVPVRLNRNFVLPVDKNFVLNETQVFRNWLFRKYFADVAAIYEFGCGPATHLAFAATLYPDKKLFGFDWAKPSQEIIRLLAKHHRRSIQGGQFDFFHPNQDLKIEPNSAVLTFGALEQIGNNHGPFLDFVLSQSPELCINVECLHELYEPDYLLDYIALKYHFSRNYLNGYLSRLQDLERQGKLEIIKVHHQCFGNLFDDSHSYVIWKPKK